MISEYENLANQVILQAVKDYRAARKKLEKNPWNRDAKAVINEVECFFRSKYFCILTDVNPEVILKQLQQEVV